MQGLWSVAKKVAVLVNRAALNGNIAPERDKGGLKPARAQRPGAGPNGGALSTILMVDNSTF